MYLDVAVSSMLSHLFIFPELSISVIWVACEQM